MAQLKNVDKIWSLGTGEQVPVGHNRTIERMTTDRFVGRLHGHPIFAIACDADGVAPQAGIVLNACGWLTTTTIAAMGDFMRAFCVRGSASREGGVLAARYMYQGEWINKTGGRGDYAVMGFTADRYPEDG